MEDNQELLRGKQVTWHKDVKDQEECKALQEIFGWSLTAEDNKESINAFIEKKCPLFWCLDTIWGSRQNAMVVASCESVTVESVTIHVAGTQIASSSALGNET
ncbi:hypothetical protein BDZ91DRAFT_295339 [Kalaharituber pfeilii]|nr:hypothetical protein BDZ91DRAFT_295339 [Kalaharituber pfeilii]